jgi:hypothetical protein
MKLRRSRPWWWVRAVSPALLAWSAASCSGEDQASGVAASKLPQSHSEAVEHEGCSESGNRVEVLDANGDGKPDIKRVYNRGTGKEICRISDLNHDGKPDLYEYYDSNGVIRRREADYDDNGVIDAIEYYEGGQLVRREYDTTGQHRIDTWDYFDKDGRHTRRERDTNNDGRVDQWWTWEGDKVTIATDKNGDGKPDPETVVVLGETADGGFGAPIPAAGGAPGASDAPAPPTAPDVKPSEPKQAALDGGASAGEAGVLAKRKGS